MKLPALRGCLRELGWRHTILEHATGGIVVALERGARILGVYPDAEGDNLVWVCPDLADREAAESRFSQTPGWNTGGENGAGSAPRLNFIFATFKIRTAIPCNRRSIPAITGWRTGRQAPQARNGGKRARRKPTEAGGALSFRMQKTCRMVEDPLQAAGLKPDDLVYAYVGYETETGIELDDRDHGPAVSLWTLLQVPAGGEALIPVYGLAEPTDFFAATGPGHLTAAPGALRFRIDARETHKISLKSVQTTGRFGYIRRGGNGICHLLVRQIAVQPSGVYRDVPAGDLNDYGHCIQFYNDDGAIGSFGGAGASLAGINAVLRRSGARKADGRVASMGLQRFGARHRADRVPLVRHANLECKGKEA
ncbi:hypothetical protein [Cohnella rhizosphaerae]|uniref:Uncharacterized protein n=1 Tax=Cohnella rhizosphaerae TaxID=1457232 RepID=A0A9X4QSX4_9BACL|nr:hypothetical protein [Cohnella rhizosphaerae]MDG0810025.1 hypothetical protein [Cohnella rhizosphaerae]